MNDVEKTKKTDEELVKLTLEEKENYRYLIERYEEKLKRYAIRISNIRAEDAEDIIQVVFLKVYENLNDFDPDLKFSSWIYRIARNEIVSNARKKKHVKELEAGEDDIWEESLVSSENIEKEFHRKFIGKEIREILNKMDEKYRDALVLKFLEEKDYKEISDILKRPMGTVATLINRAKEQFKKEAEKKRISFTEL